MKYIKNFLNAKSLEECEIKEFLSISNEAFLILKFLLKKYIDGQTALKANYVISNVFHVKDVLKVDYIDYISQLYEKNLISSYEFENINSKLLILNVDISLSLSFLFLVQKGSFSIDEDKISKYQNIEEYIQDYDNIIKLYIEYDNDVNEITYQSHDSFSHIEKYYEKLIQEKLKISKTNEIEKLFKKYNFKKLEKIIFFLVLKAENNPKYYKYKNFTNLQRLTEYNDSVIDAVNYHETKFIKSNVFYVERIDFDDDMYIAINKDILNKIFHTAKTYNKEKVEKIDLKSFVQNQNFFELLHTQENIKDIILPDKTKEILQNIIKRMDIKVYEKLKSWNIIKNKKIAATMLFYGASGTGKTMSALGLAKSLNKKVLNFDCSNILGMYVGDSEKNVRKIFDSYKEVCEKFKNPPILLLNEADQFISQRTSITGNGTEKMYNQMQNIFLEQIERFEGILIATTNFIENIDNAFSRRFDYKIEFNKPNFKERLLIWKKHLPENFIFSEDFSLNKLAKYPLTGGQIKIIVKNTAFEVAMQENSIFTNADFEKSIKLELSGAFDNEKILGFVN